MSETPYTNTPYMPAPVAGSAVTPGQQPLNASIKTINKHVFVWVGAFLFGGFGVDRFLRGQIGLGILKFLLNWLTLGIWSLIDWVIAIIKAYGNVPGEDITFINGKYTV